MMIYCNSSISETEAGESRSLNYMVNSKAPQLNGKFQGPPS